MVRFGSLYFDCPTGVHRDIPELEYIAALLQSDPQAVRASGTIKAIDIVFYLLSRHGVQVSEDLVEERIMTELAGSLKNDNDKFAQEDEKDDKPRGKVLDICQMAAILIIPELVQAAADEKNESKETNLFSAFEKELGGALPNNKEALRETLRKNVVLFDADDISDDLLDEMLAVARGGTAEALTSDIAHFNMEWTNSTDCDDSSTEGRKQATDSTAVNDIRKTGNHEIRQVYSAPAIDYAADTVRRPLAVMLLWSSGITAHFAYVLLTTNQGEWLNTHCNGDLTACKVVDGITMWLAIFVQLVLLGLPFIWLGSLGNSAYAGHTWNSVASTCTSIAAMSTFIIVPYFKVTTMIWVWKH